MRKFNKVQAGYESEGGKSSESRSTSATIIPLRRIATGGNDHETPKKKKTILAPSSSRVIRTESRLSLTADELNAKQQLVET